MIYEQNKKSKVDIIGVCNRKNKRNTEIFAVFLMIRRSMQKRDEEGDWGGSRNEEVWYIVM